MSDELYDIIESIRDKDTHRTLRLLEQLEETKVLEG